ncbi:thioesterase [Aureimonas ureilytica]|uniref:Thioesterase n=1 Tax=Aureimonas ureilytica TaxID=401562 RepID=A0A175RJZ9_9HYPH|nr:thioesterase family protein [Aureimonas ureilytica]KTR04087.1 thioesterase [Aureimonas ureilytica]
MPHSALRTSLGWVPTIALSWFWGLGFFYAIHVTRTYGWTGFFAFALANALGFFLFGWVLGRTGRDPAMLWPRLQGPFTGLFLLAQIAAVAVSLQAFVAYLAPLGGVPAMALLAGLVVLAACAIGHAVSIGMIRRLHALYLPLGVGAALVALVTLRGGGQPLLGAINGLDGRFFGLVLPTLVGFLLGPWTDVQQWQRAVEIRKAGGSVRLAYGLGAALFFGLLLLNAGLAVAAGMVTPPAASSGFWEPASVAGALAERSGGLAGSAFLVWASIALLSTVDGAYAALRWLLAGVTARSSSPLLAIVPASLVASPLWVLALAVALAAVAVQAQLPMIYLMMPFATLLAGPAACLLARVLGRRGRYDSVLCYLIGFASMLLFVIGYAGPVPSLLGLSALVALIGALPMLLQPGEPETQPSKPDAPSEPANQPVQLAPLAPAGKVAELSAAHGFDGDWFVMRMVPTYDDTNSVGNVYFANYMRWVGKARELFFNQCMPEFDLASTSFYVLTRSFQHDFRREAQEFEPIIVRIRIETHNRKFVTLAHEIHSENQGLLGRGSQSLMFVDTKDYRPLDIPSSIIRGFLPYWPKTSGLNARGAGAASLSEAL